MTYRRRPPKHVVRRLLEQDGKSVTVEELDIREDVDGIPAAIRVHREQAVLVADPELLGWTWAELDNPNITE